MTDRELLELAAKAAGYSYLTEGDSKDCYIAWSGRYPIAWNPLTDDGNAKRLLTVRNIEIRFTEKSVIAATSGAWEEVEFDPSSEESKQKAVNRAIVQAVVAAEIGKTK